MIKKNEIKLFTLASCNRCASIKSRLQLDNIEFVEVDCTPSDCEECDKVEDSIDCGRYPIAIVKSEKGKSIIHTCENKKSSTNKISVNSEDMFMNELKKAYF